MKSTTTRRDFFKLTILATGGFMLKAKANASERSNTSFSPSPFIEININGKITLTAHIPEIGQGIKTSLPMIIAEELEVDWQQIQVVSKVANEKLFGNQNAGGSQSTPKNYNRLRKLGAAAKQTLINAAADKWNVPATECSASSGKIIHNEKSLTYAELASDASKLKAPNPKTIQLKDPKNFKLLGQRIPGVDNQKIVTGQPLFGIDQIQPDMKYAAFLRSPSFSGEVKNANLDKIKKMPGVSDAYIVKSAPAPMGGVFGGVAVIANSTWNAWKAKDALEIEWDQPDTSIHDSEKYAKLAVDIITTKKNKAPKKPQVKHSLEAIYHYPLLAHNTMEPQNCTALYKNGSFEFWAPTQAPSAAIKSLGKVFKIKPAQIKIHVTRSGGGFGRRIKSDFILEAAAIAKQSEGIPIKLTWTREQDIQQDYYRNAGWHHLEGGLNSSGKIVEFSDHLVSLGANNKPGTGGRLNKKVFPFPFLPQSKITNTVINTNIPFGWWRAPGSNGFAFAIQCFIDELAHKAGKDPVDFRLEVLKTKSKGYSAKRMIGALKAATKKADWGKTLPKGSAQGVAFYFSHRGFVAVVAEVTVSKEGQLIVDKLTAGVDVGPIVNLSGAENQVFGSMLDGLSSALYQKIEIVDGIVKNNNFDDYPVLRMPNTPKMEVTFIEADIPPTGLGEPALPPTIPAVCNAIYRATGKRIRSLPISDHDLSWT